MTYSEMNDMNDPGTYVVEADGKEKEVDVDAFRYGDAGELQAVKDGSTIAIFKWWSAVWKKA